MIFKSRKQSQNTPILWMMMLILNGYIYQSMSAPMQFIKSAGTYLDNATTGMGKTLGTMTEAKPNALGGSKAVLSEGIDGSVSGSGKSSMMENPGRLRNGAQSTLTDNFQKIRVKGAQLGDWMKGTQEFTNRVFKSGSGRSKSMNEFKKRLESLKQLLRSLKREGKYLYKDLISSKHLSMSSIIQAFKSSASRLSGDIDMGRMKGKLW